MEKYITRRYRISELGKRIPSPYDRNAIKYLEEINKKHNYGEGLEKDLKTAKEVLFGEKRISLMDLMATSSLVLTALGGYKIGNFDLPSIIEAIEESYQTCRRDPTKEILYNMLLNALKRYVDDPVVALPIIDEKEEKVITIPIHLKRLPYENVNLIEQHLSVKEYASLLVTITETLKKVKRYNIETKNALGNLVILFYLQIKNKLSSYGKLKNGEPEDSYTVAQLAKDIVLSSFGYPQNVRRDLLTTLNINREDIETTLIPTYVKSFGGRLKIPEIEPKTSKETEEKIKKAINGMLEEFDRLMED